MVNVNNIVHSFADIFRDSAGKLKAQLRRVREELEAAKRRREELLTRPLPAEERAALVCDTIDRRAAKYEERFLKSTEYLARKPMLNAGDPLLDQLGVLTVPFKRDTLATLTDMELAISYYFGDVLKDGVRRAFKAEKIECGPGRQQRAVELQELERRIVELESQERQMLDEVASIRSDLNV